MILAQLNSKIDKVKVYAAGATVARIAPLQLVEGQIPSQIEISGLPLALEDSSVKARIQSNSTAIVTDIRIGLAVSPHHQQEEPPEEKEIQAARVRVQRLEDLLLLIEKEIKALHSLAVPDRPQPEKGQAPLPSPIATRLALANFKDEQIRSRTQQQRTTQEQLRQAKEQLADLHQQKLQKSSAKLAKPEELRKTAIVSLEYDGDPSAFSQQNLVLEYLVPGARWTPTYVCNLDSQENRATIALRALICQHTGEDWSGVRLELSTAQPDAWCELPELYALRIGKVQPSLPAKKGWRKPPLGAESLFADFDRQQQIQQSHLSVRSEIQSFATPQITSLPKIDFILDDVALTARSSEIEAEMDDFGGSALVDDADLLLGGTGSNLESEVESYRYRQAPQKKKQTRSLLAGSLPRQAQGIRARKVRSETLRQEEETTQLKKEIQLEGTYSTPFGLIRFGAGNESENRGYSTHYGLMRLGEVNDSKNRGKLLYSSPEKIYLELLNREEVTINFNVMTVIQKAVIRARKCLSLQLPSGGINVRKVAESFDYAYTADSRVDLPSDGLFHSVALTRQTTNADLSYVVVPREDPNVFRIAKLHNPLNAPLLSGPADIYLDGEYILSSKIKTVPPRGKMELGLGVEQAIKVARNSFYREARSHKTIVAFNEFKHQIKIEIVNPMSRHAKIEVRERVPIPEKNAKVDVEIGKVTPQWEEYHQEERNAPIKGGYRWQVEVEAGKEMTLEANYKIKTFVDKELVGGNRRE